jgi:hypothetical protein
MELLPKLLLMSIVLIMIGGFTIDHISFNDEHIIKPLGLDGIFGTIDEGLSHVTGESAGDGKIYFMFMFFCFFIGVLTVIYFHYMEE